MMKGDSRVLAEKQLNIKQEALCNNFVDECLYGKGGVREWVSTLHHEWSAVWLAYSADTRLTGAFI